MTKKQLKKVKRAKLLKKKHNQTRNKIKKEMSPRAYMKKTNEPLIAMQLNGQNVLVKKADLDDWWKRYEAFTDECLNITHLHEDDFIPHDCYLCGEKIETIYDSNNPFPLIDYNATAKDENGKDEPKRCCTKCENSIVLPARRESIDNGCVDHPDAWEERMERYSQSQEHGTSHHFELMSAAAYSMVA
jgi:hypothetical protein